MADCKERIEAEFEAIENTLNTLPEKKLNQLSELELAGISTLLYNFYNGLENILKQVFRKNSLSLPAGPSWHQELVTLSVKENIISHSLAKELKRYLAFRHFAAHGYAMNLNADKLEKLTCNVFSVYKQFKEEIIKLF